MKRLLLLPLLLSSVFTFAHEGGHGPIPDESSWSKPDRSPREGGVLMPVVLAAAKGPDSELIYNAELVRAEDVDAEPARGADSRPARRPFAGEEADQRRFERD